MKQTADELLSSIEDQISKYFMDFTGTKTIKKKSSSKKAKCKYCGKEKFYWGETKWGWRLFDNKNEQHMCKESNGAKK